MSSIPTIVQALEKTANQKDADTRKSGEKEVKALSADPGFWSSLLTIAWSDIYSFEARWLALIYLKNNIDALWRRTKNPVAITSDEKAVIRGQLLPLSRAQLPSKLHRQVAIITARIARCDYPRAWPTIFDELKCLIIESANGKSPAELANVMVSTQQVVKAVTTARIGLARAELNKISPSLVKLLGYLYMHLMNQQNDESLTVAYSSLKAICTLMYNGSDRCHRFQEYCVFFQESLVVLQQLMRLLREQDSELLRKHILRFGKLYSRLLEKHPLSFCLMPNSLNVVEFYVAILMDFADDYTSDKDCRLDQSFFDKVVIQGMTIVRNILNIVRRDPSKSSTNQLPLTMQPRDERDRQDFLTSYELFNNLYFSANNFQKVEQITTVLITKYFSLRASDLESWDEDPENFFIDLTEADPEFQLRLSAELLFSSLIKVYPQQVGPLSMNFVATTIERNADDMQQIIKLDNALQCLQFGAQNFSKFVQIEPMLLQVFLPMLERTVNPTLFRIIGSRLAFVIIEWLPLQSSEEFRQLVYRVVINMYFSNTEANDLVIQLVALQALKTAIDDIDFDMEGFLPYTEATLQHIFKLITSAESMEIKKYILEILCTVVEQVGRKMNTDNCNTLLEILSQLWANSKSSELLKCVILQSLTNVVYATRDLSPITYSVAIPILRVSVDLNNPLSSVLMDDALGLWKGLLVSAMSSSEQICSIFPVLLMLLDHSNEHLAEVLDVTLSYLRLEPLLFDDSKSTFKLFTVAKEHFACATLEISMSVLQCLLEVVKKLPLADYADSIVESGLISILFNTISSKEGTTEPPLVVGIRETRVVLIFSWMAFHDPRTLKQIIEHCHVSGNACIFMEQCLCKVQTMSDPYDRKVFCLGLTQLLLEEPQAFLTLASKYIDMWSVLLDEVVETAQGDAEIYHAKDDLYPGESDDDLLPEQLRMREARLKEPVHGVNLCQFLEMVHSKLWEQGTAYQEALNGWKPLVAAR